MKLLLKSRGRIKSFTVLGLVWSEWLFVPRVGGPVVWNKFGIFGHVEMVTNVLS